MYKKQFISQMKQSILFLLFLSTVQPLIGADEYHLSQDQRNVLTDVPHFQEAYRSTNIPPEVLTLCDAGTTGLAEPGQKWNASDTIDPNLPRKRLIWIATKDEFYVIHYEKGGIAHTSHIAFIRFKPGEGANVIWRAHGGLFKNYKEFAQALKRNELYEDRSSSLH